MREINTDQLNLALKSPSCSVIDARPNSAFIGWKVAGAQRRGHLPRSSDFSAHWFFFLDTAVLSKSEISFKEKLLRQRLDLKKLEEKEKVILYDNNSQDAKRVARYFKEHGIDQLYYYDLNQWEGDLVSYPNFSDLVPAEWVYAVINGDQPDFYDGKGYKIFECSWGKENITFLSSHIPGAVHIDTDEFEKEPEWVRKSDKKLKQVLIDNGIDFDSTVILYSNGSECAEYKVALLLKYLGHPKVKIMNGGYVAWRIMNYPTERGSVQKPSLNPNLEPTLDLHPELICDMSEAKKILSGEISGKLIDGRPWEEYSGEVSGYKYIHRTGRIPGSVWGGSYLDYKNIDDTMRNYQDVLAILDQHQINPDETMAYFCGSAGWGAAMIQFFGHLVENYNVITFEGGWNEWQLDESNPVDVGVLKEEKINDK